MWPTTVTATAYEFLFFFFFFFQFLRRTRPYACDPKKIPNQISVRIRRLKSKTRREFPASRSAAFCSGVLHIYSRSRMRCRSQTGIIFWRPVLRSSVSGRVQTCSFISRHVCSRAVSIIWRTYLMLRVVGRWRTVNTRKIKKKSSHYGFGWVGRTGWFKFVVVNDKSLLTKMRFWTSSVIEY